MGKLAAIAAGAVCLTGCATAYTVTPTADEAANTTYDRGTATVASNLQNGAVKVTPMGITRAGFMKFAVAAINRTSSPVNVGTENITVTDANGVRLHIYTRAELIRIARRRAAMAQVALAFAGAAAAYGNSYASTSTTYGQVGGTYFSATTYNPALNNALNQQTAAETGAAMANVNAQLDDIIANLGNSALETDTVGPYRGFGGYIWVAKPKGLADSKTPPVINVSVNFAGETHPFKFQVAKF